MFTDTFNDSKLKLTNTTETDTLLRQGFFGGSCAVAGNPYKEERIFHFDFANMYGDLLCGIYPLGDLILEQKPVLLKKRGFYYCKIRSTGMRFPILPHYTTSLNPLNSYLPQELKIREVVNSNGQFEGLFYIEELEYFKHRGGEILEIDWALIFESSELGTPFKRYMTHLIEQRLKGPKYL
jgi:hypothetical protein